MAVVIMEVQPEMKVQMLNNWRAKTNYGVIITRDGEVGDSAELSFDEPTWGNSSKITHEKPGGTDLVVGNNVMVEYFVITRNNTDALAPSQATTPNIGEIYTYGGVFRINKIEIALT